MINHRDMACLARFFSGLSIVVFTFLCFGVALAMADNRIVKVGVYENSPKIFISESGKPAGIFIDLIEHIAKSEGWNLRYVPGTWGEGLDRLERGEIDLMPDVAYAAHREKIFAFHKEPVLSSWFQVYACKGSGIHSILDLAGKRIAVLDRSVQQEAFIRLAAGFGLSTNLISLPDYQTLFESVAGGEVDAAITNRFYGLMHAKRLGLEDTAVIFHPIDLFFAAPEGTHKKLLNAIDAHLIDLKKDTQSIYYQSLKRWISEEVRFKLPDWIKAVALVAVFILLLSLAGSVILKYQVNARTRELRFINLELEKEVRMRREAEEILRASERKYRLLADNTLDVIWAMDPELTFTYVNPAIRSLMGYTPDEWIGTRLSEHCDDENFTKIVQVIADKMARGPEPPGVILEAVLLNKNREPIPFEIHGKVNYNEKREPTSIQGVARDVSERKRAEGALKRSEMSLKTVFQSAIDGMLVADMKTGRFVMANHAICRMLGYSSEEIKRLCVADIHPVESMDHVRQQFKRQARSEISLAPGIPVKRRDGSVFFADVNSAVLNLEGRPHLLGIFRDVTERRESEKALREAYDIINRTSSVAFTWKNQGGWPVAFVSENVEKLFGYAAEEFMSGKVDYAACVHPDDLERVVKEMAEFSGKAEKAGIAHEPYRIITKDGSEKIVKDRTYIVKDHDGRITHYKGIVEDITGQQRAEDERKSLEHQLFQSQKLEAVGTLTAGIAHDFNNLLTSVIGNAELMLMETGKEDPLREMTEEIKRAGEKASGLTRQLLAFSRKQILQPEVMILNHVVKEMDRMLRRIIGEDIDLKTHLSPDLSPVEADVGQVEQVLMNLVVNARDAMPMGGKLTIETKNVKLDEDYANAHIAMKSGPCVVLAVTDTGIGMTKETLEKIFEPFFTTKGKNKGTGLGLSTVYGIVKQSGGNIRVYSDPGQGTTFKIYLPVVEEAVSERAKAEGDAAELRGSETILVVEDDEMVRNIVLKALEKKGYTVFTAADGNEALQWCEEHKDPIHLMVTDMVMPDMSGMTLADRLKTLKPEMKVLFMSGYTDNAIVHHEMFEKGIAFIQKPFTPDGLTRKVRKVLWEIENRYLKLENGNLKLGYLRLRGHGHE